MLGFTGLAAFHKDDTGVRYQLVVIIVALLHHVDLPGVHWKNCTSSGRDYTPTAARGLRSPCARITNGAPQGRYTMNSTCVTHLSYDLLMYSWRSVITGVDCSVAFKQSNASAGIQEDV